MFVKNKFWLQFLSQSQSVCLDCHFRAAAALQFASGSNRCFNILRLLHHIPPPWPPCLWLIAEGAEKRKEEGGSLVLWYTSCLPKSTFKPLQCGPHYSIYASSFFFFQLHCSNSQTNYFLFPSRSWTPGNLWSSFFLCFHLIWHIWDVRHQEGDSRMLFQCFVSSEVSGRRTGADDGIDSPSGLLWI